MPSRLAIILLIFTLVGCSTETLYRAPDVSAETLAAQYKLGAGDQVRVTVFNQNNLSGEFAIDGAGVIAIPLLGPIKAGGHTLRELELAITTALTQGGYLVKPSVAVQVIQFRPYYILGEVSQPGAYPYTASLTVRNAVAAARGYTYRANTRRVYIQRGGEQIERLYELTPSTAVLPGDTVRIPERLF